MAIKVELFHKNQVGLWNKFVANAKNATFLFDRNFMDYHNDRFKDFSLMVYKNESLIAVLPANIKDSIVYSHQGLTYGGLLIASGTKFSDVLDGFKAVLRFLNSKGISVLNLKVLPAMYTVEPADELLYFMFLLQADLYRRDVLSVVNLKANLPFSKDRIAGSKRAVRHGLIVREETGFEAFWNKILIPNLNEKHNVSPVHSLEEITLLKSKFPEQIRQFNVYYQDEIVAGTTIFETDQVAHSQYISANSSKNHLGSLDFLHTYVIREVFNQKSYFDFGISNENNGKHINQGLQYWKEGFGARSIVQDFYRVETARFSDLDSVWI